MIAAWSCGEVIGPQKVLVTLTQVAGHAQSGIVGQPLVQPLVVRVASVEGEPAELANGLAAGAEPITVTLRRDDLGTNVVMARTDVSTDGGEPSWYRVSEAYPGAVAWLRLTRPAFSESGAMAMVAVDMRCGHGCASGWLLLLEGDQDDTWRVARQMVLWIT